VKTQLIGIATNILIAGGLLLVLRACDVSAEARGIWAGSVGYAAGDFARMILDRRRQARKS
jgi:hypothetical protein